MNPNPTIARLDRDARRFGTELRITGKNSREFSAGGRTYRYKPCGKGIVKIQAFIDGQLEAEASALPERVCALFSQE